MVQAAIKNISHHPAGSSFQRDMALSQEKTKAKQNIFLIMTIHVTTDSFQRVDPDSTGTLE